MSDILIRFKLVKSRGDGVLNLGPKKQYKFVDGICEFTCSEEDAPRHSHTLETFYGAKRVKPSKGAKEEPLPDDDDVGDGDGDGDGDDNDEPKKKGSGKSK